jgi:hypothetical protein
MRKLSNLDFGGILLKNKIFAFFALFLCACTALCSCGADVSALENLCFAVGRFDLEKAEKYVFDAEGYFEDIRELEGELTEEQREIAKEVYSYMSFSDFSEKDGVCAVTVKYIDVAELMRNANGALASGTGTASEYLRDAIDSGAIKNLFLKTAKSVKVVLSKENDKAKVPLGYTSENADFTRLLGLDTFLRWYSLQR